MEQIAQPAPERPIGPPKNWLVESILVTIFCCLPFGIAGIVFASQVNAKHALADYQGALKASREARRWTLIGFFVGGGWLLLIVLAIVASSVFMIPFPHWR